MKGILGHAGNPFNEEFCGLANMYQNNVIQGDGEDVILECDSKEQIRYKEFVTRRLIKNSERSMWNSEEDETKNISIFNNSQQM